MKSFLVLITMGTALVGLAACTDTYEQYPVVSTDNGIHQSHHHYTRHYSHYHDHDYPVVHQSHHSGISQSYS